MCRMTTLAFQNSLTALKVKQPSLENSMKQILYMKEHEIAHEKETESYSLIKICAVPLL